MWAIRCATLPPDAHRCKPEQLPMHCPQPRHPEQHALRCGRPPEDETAHQTVPNRAVQPFSGQIRDSEAIHAPTEAKACRPIVVPGPLCCRPPGTPLTCSDHEGQHFARTYVAWRHLDGADPLEVWACEVCGVASTDAELKEVWPRAPGRAGCYMAGAGDGVRVGLGI